MSGRSRKQLSAHAMRKRQKGVNLASEGTHYDVDLRAPPGTTTAESHLHRLYMEAQYCIARDIPLNVRIGGVPARKNLSKSQVLKELHDLVDQIDLVSVPKGVNNMELVQSIMNMINDPDYIEHRGELKHPELIDAVANMKDDECLEVGSLDGEFIFTKKEGTEEI